MDKQKHLTTIASACLGLLTLTFIYYVIFSLDFISYLRKTGVQDSESTRASYFNDLAFAPMFKYFVWAIIFVFACTYYLEKPRLKIMAALSFILSIWLIISALQEFYSILSFNIVVIIGTILELIAIALYVLLLIQKGDKPELAIKGE